MSVDGKSLSENRHTAIVDTGTSLILGSEREVLTLTLTLTLTLSLSLTLTLSLSLCYLSPYLLAIHERGDG